MSYPSIPAPILAWDVNVQAPNAILGLMPVMSTVLTSAFDGYESVSQEFMRTVPMSNTGQLVLPMIDRLLAPAVWVDDVIIQPVIARALGVTAIPYAQGFALDRFFLEDSGPQVANYLETVFTVVGHSIKSFPDLLAAQAIESMPTSPYYDGTYFVATNHPINPEQPSLGTWSNLFVNTPLTRLNLWKMLAQFMQIPGRDGLPWSNRRKGIKLIVPAALYPLAVNAVRSTLMATAVSEPGLGVSGVASENNTFLKMAVEDVIPLLTWNSTTDWLLVDCANAPVPPIVLGLREAFRVIPRVSETDPVNWGQHKLLYKTEGRMAPGLTIAQNALYASAASSV